LILLETYHSLSKETHAMTATPSIDLARFLPDQLAEASPDLLRQMLSTFINTLMPACPAHRSPGWPPTWPPTWTPPGAPACRPGRRCPCARARGRLLVAGVDAAFGTVHKWFPVPRSVGILWTAPGLAGQVHPAEASLTYDADTLDRRFAWPGTFDPAARLVVPDAVSPRRPRGRRAELPDRLVKAIMFVRGPADGEAWLQALPLRVDLYLRRWNLEPLEVAEGGAMSCCLYCVTDTGREGVLKIPFDAASGRLESRSLARWARSGASPEVLATAPSSGVFLMSRVRPGTTATPTNQVSDAEYFCDLITRMTRPELGPMKGLKTIEAVVRMRLDWAVERFRDPGYEQEREQLRGVKHLLRRLLDTAGPPTAIHGDLQAKNILTGPDGRWQAIDPFTCLGDLNAEAALWAVVQSDGSTIDERIDQLARCPLLDETRLRAWTYPLAEKIRKMTSGLPAAGGRERCSPPVAIGSAHPAGMRAVGPASKGRRTTAEVRTRRRWFAQPHGHTSRGTSVPEPWAGCVLRTAAGVDVPAGRHAPARQHTKLTVCPAREMSDERWMISDTIRS
jgi:streptomycin 6-kinase